MLGQAIGDLLPLALRHCDRAGCPIIAVILMLFSRRTAGQQLDVHSSVGSSVCWAGRSSC